MVTLFSFSPLIAESIIGDSIICACEGKNVNAATMAAKNLFFIIMVIYVKLFFTTDAQIDAA